MGGVMNKKKKTQHKARHEDVRALKARNGTLKKHNAGKEAVSGAARTGKQARKQLRNVRRSERNKIDDAAKAAAAEAASGGDTVMK